MLIKNETCDKGVKVVSRLRLHAHRILQRKARPKKTWRWQVERRSGKKVYNKREDSERVRKKKVASDHAANKNNKTIASGMRATKVTIAKDEIGEKRGLVDDDVSTRKPLDIQLEASGSKKTIEEVIDVTTANVLRPEEEADTSNTKLWRFTTGMLRVQSLR